MTDLILDEHNGISPKISRNILQEEARKMFNSDAVENNIEDGISITYLPFHQKHKKVKYIFRCWRSIKNFFVSDKIVATYK